MASIAASWSGRVLLSADPNMALYYFGWWRMNALGIFAIVPPAAIWLAASAEPLERTPGRPRGADGRRNGRRDSPADAPASRQRDGRPAPRRRPPDLALRGGSFRAERGRERGSAGGDRRRAGDRLRMGAFPFDRPERPPLRRPGLRAAADHDAAGPRSPGRRANGGGEDDGVRGPGPGARRRRAAGGGGLRGNRRGDGGAHEGALLDPDDSGRPDGCRHAAGAASWPHALLVDADPGFLRRRTRRLRHLHA